jgi:predicted alpha/beta hydrolase
VAETVPVLSEVRTPDGVRFTVRALRRDDPTAAVVLVLPAMGATARFYLPFAQELHRAGLTVALVDLRGHGESTPAVVRGSRFGYREMFGPDLDAVLDAVRSALPAAPVFLLGHSLGGQLALLSAVRREPDLDGVVLIAAGSVWFRGFGLLRGLRNLFFSQLFALLATAFGYWPGDRLGFGGRESAGVMRDWARQGRTGRYRFPGAATDVERGLGELRLPVLAVGVDNDTLAPPGCVDHLCGKIPRAALTRWQYTDEAAGGKRVDHFRWVRHNTALAGHVAAWISGLGRSTGATGQPTRTADGQD